MAQLVQLDPITHTYTVAGEVFTGVTRPLLDLKRLENVPRDDLIRARERGAKGDRAIMLYIDDNLDEASLDPVLVPFLEGWKKAVARYGIRVVAKQQLVWHPVYRYAGTFDVVCEMDRPPQHARPGAFMAELKCVRMVGPEVGLQLAAYAEAYNHALDTAQNFNTLRARNRVAFQLLDTGDFTPHWFTKRTDFMTFCGCLYRLNFLLENEHHYGKQLNGLRSQRQY